MSSLTADSNLAPPAARGGWLHRAFACGVALKGALAGLEMVAGLLLALFGAAAIHLAQSLAPALLAAHPHDHLLAAAARAAAGWSPRAEHFCALFLIAHGAVKALAAGALLTERRWAFPFGIAILSAFVLYQLVRYVETGAIALLAVSLFDLLVIGLIAREYRSKFG